MYISIPPCTVPIGKVSWVQETRLIWLTTSRPSFGRPNKIPSDFDWTRTASIRLSSRGFAIGFPALVEINSSKFFVWISLELNGKVSPLETDRRWRSHTWVYPTHKICPLPIMGSPRSHLTTARVYSLLIIAYCFRVVLDGIWFLNLRCRIK